MKEVKEKKRLPIDGIMAPNAGPLFFGAAEVSSLGGYSAKASPMLFSRGKKSVHFFTEDSKRYITPWEQELEKGGVTIDKSVRKWDNVSSRVIREFRRQNPGYEKSYLYTQFMEKYAKIRQNMLFEKPLAIGSFSPIQLWNASIVGALLLGMISMSFIYRYLGQDALAGSTQINSAQMTSGPLVAQVLGAESMKKVENDEEYLNRIIEEIETGKKDEIESTIREMVKGYPIEAMVPYIAEKDPIVAAFIVSIARKESGWGVHVPVLNGQDCYNYWGYRGQRALMGTGGHTCFNSRKDAVDTVAKRIDFLVNNKKLNTPAKMVIWKCGSDCGVTGGHAAAQKWISDVDFYFKKLNK